MEKRRNSNHLFVRLLNRYDKVFLYKNVWHDFNKKICLDEHDESNNGGYYIDRGVFLWSPNLGLKRIQTKTKKVNLLTLLLSVKKVKALPSYIVIEKSGYNYKHLRVRGGGHISQNEDLPTEAIMYHLTKSQKEELFKEKLIKSTSKK